jgi:hypothetical protein
MGTQGVFLPEKLMFIALGSCVRKFSLVKNSLLVRAQGDCVKELVPQKMKGHFCLRTTITLQNYFP